MIYINRFNEIRLAMTFFRFLSYPLNHIEKLQKDFQKKNEEFDEKSKDFMKKL